MQAGSFDLLAQQSSADDAVWVPMTAHDRSRCEEAFQTKARIKAASKIGALSSSSDAARLLD